MRPREDPELADRFTAIEVALQDTQRSLADNTERLVKIETALLGIDGESGLVKKFDRLEKAIRVLEADYSERRGVRRFQASAWAVIGGFVVVVFERIISRLFG